MSQFEPKPALTEITAYFKQALNDNLVGIYLHGSLAMGCFNSKTSDIDLVIVVKTLLSFNTKKTNSQILTWIQ